MGGRKKERKEGEISERGRAVREQYIYDLNSDRSRCIICQRKFKGRHYSSLNKHLLRLHPIVLEHINTRWGDPKWSSVFRYSKENWRDVQKQYIYDHTRNRSQCIICKRNLKGNISLSLRRHLSRLHPKVLEDINTRWGARKWSSLFRHGEEESSSETNDTVLSTASAPMKLNNSVLSEIKIEVEQVTSSSLGADPLQTRDPSPSLNEFAVVVVTSSSLRTEQPLPTRVPPPNPNEFADVGATSGSLRSGSLQNRDPPPNANEFAAFGDYVGATIGRLRSKRAKIAVKYLINNILLKAESGEYDGGILQTVGEENPIDTSTVKSETIAAPT